MCSMLQSYMREKQRVFVVVHMVSHAAETGAWNVSPCTCHARSQRQQCGLRARHVLKFALLSRQFVRAKSIATDANPRHSVNHHTTYAAHLRRRRCEHELLHVLSHNLCRQSRNTVGSDPNGTNDNVAQQRTSDTTAAATRVWTP